MAAMTEHFEQQTKNKTPEGFKRSCSEGIPAKPSTSSSILHMLIARKIKSYFIDLIHQACRLYCVLNPYILLTLVQAACLYRKYKAPLPHQKQKKKKLSTFYLPSLGNWYSFQTPLHSLQCFCCVLFPKKTFVVAFLGLKLGYPLSIFLRKKDLMRIWKTTMTMRINGTF